MSYTALYCGLQQWVFVFCFCQFANETSLYTSRSLAALSSIGELLKMQNKKKEKKGVAGQHFHIPTKRDLCTAAVSLEAGDCTDTFFSFLGFYHGDCFVMEENNLTDS